MHENLNSYSFKGTVSPNFPAFLVYATKMDVTEQQWQIYKFSEEIPILKVKT